MFPVTLAAIAGASWWWQTTVFHSQPLGIRLERWERVKEAYSLPQETQEAPKTSSKDAQEIILANPFSPKRRLAALPVEGGPSTEPGEAGQPPPPKFIYKGHINVGTRPRAIVEDIANHKTHFLEVGQEVTGFKVLDITENRVVLSDLRTGENVVVSLSTTPKSAPQSSHAPSAQGAVPAAVKQPASP